jgi:hypothetical protein
MRALRRWSRSQQHGFTRLAETSGSIGPYSREVQQRIADTSKWIISLLWQAHPADSRLRSFPAVSGS